MSLNNERLLLYFTFMRYFLLIPLFFFVLASCSHDYDSNTLDLSFYQWNLWAEEEAGSTENLSKNLAADSSDLSSHPPSCGWDVLHRGIGKLVRIPALMEEHLADADDKESGSEEHFSGVSWFHTRFTLPELWAERDIELKFEDTGPVVQVYLNEILVGSHRGEGASFSIDVTRDIYYVRDNHLAIRITSPERGPGGSAGSIKVVSSELERPETSR